MYFGLNKYNYYIYNSNVSISIESEGKEDAGVIMEEEDVNRTTEGENKGIREQEGK